jgi:pyridoxal phosphate-dependent aminotransferase EpsN
VQVLDERVMRRREIFEDYAHALKRPGISFMPEPSGYRSSRWLTTMTVEPAQAGITREDIRLALIEHEIECRPLWKPMHMQPLFKGSRYVGDGNDERLFENGLCLPSGSDMSAADQSEVIGRIIDLLDRA